MKKTSNMFQNKICLLLSRNSKADHDRLTGALKYFRENPKWDIRVINASSFDFNNECRHVLADWLPDGIIYSDPSICKKLLSKLSRRPFLAEIDYHIPNLNPEVRISIDDEGIAYLAAELLVKRGFRHLGYFGTGFMRERHHSEARERGIRAMAKKASTSFSVFTPLMPGKGRSYDINSAAQWLNTLPKPCGILAYADEEAQTLYEACLLTKVDIPRQVGVIGIDNELDICENLMPTLTSILPAFERSGSLASELLTTSLASSKRFYRSYGISKLIERASSQDVTGAGRIATAVNEIIRLEATRPLSIGDIAKRLNISERLMEIHFKSVTGSTISDELHRLRLHNICMDLSGSSRSITEIVCANGYKTINAAQRIFKRKMGVSMRTWREKNRSKLS